MTDNEGGPPKAGWPKLIVELLVSDLQVSRAFWEGRLGFSVAYHRLEAGFVYLERAEGAQIMLHERKGVWETGPLERPFGRGVMLQVYVASLEELTAKLGDWEVHAGPREVWRRHGDREGGAREIFVLDPDGYLVMISQSLGERPLVGVAP
jgi:catechol 2,3-dioxygenase-like lactoylglutathione lyase family enzyme